MKKLLFVLLFSCSLQGCFFVAGAAAGAAAVAVVYDHRTLENALQDTNIANQIADRIHQNKNLKDESHIEVTVFNRIVLLTGETPDAAWREEAGAIAHSISEVSRVYNQISVQGPTSSLTRTSDSWITTKIKSKMLATEDLKSSSVKVLTENGVVYLMGFVTKEQAEISVNIARKVSGVEKVVRIFQYKK